MWLCAMVQAMCDRCVMGLEAASSVRVHGVLETSYDAMVTFSPLSQISDPAVDCWSCGEATTGCDVT